MTNLDVGRDGQNARLQYRDDDGVAPRLRLRILFAPGQRHADACGHEVSVNQSDAGGLIMRDRPFSFVVYSSEIRDFGDWETTDSGIVVPQLEKSPFES